MPNPRKPDSLKRLHGTLRPNRVAPPSVALPLLTTAPEPPGWLTCGHAITEWRRLAPILVSCQLLPEASLGSLGVLCAVYGSIITLVAAGETPRASLVATYRALASDFGLTPLSQQRIQPPAPPAQRNPFSELRDAVADFQHLAEHRQ